jgi:pyrroloquinoline quinone biosynthesis protein B
VFERQKRFDLQDLQDFYPARFRNLQERRIMLRVVVLGAAAGGGVPQWNCGCAVCRAARNERPELRSTQASIAMSADGDHWFLINASPDLRQQLTETPQLHPKPGQLRHSPVTGVILTNGEIDAIAGLLSMREGSPFTIYAHAKVLAILKANSIFNVLSEKSVRRQAIEVDQPFQPRLQDGSPSGIEILPFAVSGKGAWYLEGKAHPGGNEATGDTLGLRVKDKRSGKYFYFIAACAGVTDELKTRLAGAPLVFFDGTVWRDDELIAAGLGNKTGQAMGHIAMSGEHGVIAALEDLDIGQRLFLHINNSNPALLRGSSERDIAERAGWRIPADGTEIVL